MGSASWLEFEFVEIESLDLILELFDALDDSLETEVEDAAA